ncbi:thiamine-phosphate kinase [Paenibacillus filicis]|uniref:Thiamine-monophosphate kinase n=1 Tax=Paenibacillus filicis TaxID=669464 RepID=A0ABU9DJ90_9BACL
MSQVDEFSLIRLLTGGKQTTAFQREGGVVTGIGDDAAVVNVNSGTQWILTCDTMTEEVHFKQVTMRDRDVGFKAMGSAVSDIAAMGGQPRFALIALCAPKGTDMERVKAMYDGLYACASRYGVVIVGGDTTSTTGGITISVTVIGEAPAGKALLRSTATEGDAVFVTGYLGRSAAGLEWLLQRNIPSGLWEEEEGAAEEMASLEGIGAYPLLVEAHCRPLPQIEAGLALSESGVCHALNDVSDGLSSEAWEIVEASAIGIDLMEDLIPIADDVHAYAISQGRSPLDYVLNGGEDYQLLGTVPAEHAPAVQARLGELGIAFHKIGRVNSAHREVRLIRNAGESVVLDKKGYNHFSGRDEG